MKTRYILATEHSDPNESSYKFWLPTSACVFDLNSNGIINSFHDVGGTSYCDILCDVYTHERYIEIEKFGASNPLELMMKLDLYS